MQKSVERLAFNDNKCLCFLKSRFFQPAEVYWRNAQIGSNHVLRRPVMDVWKNFGEGIVSLLRRSGVEVFDAVVLIDEVKFGNQPPQFVALGKVGVAPLDGRTRQYDNGGFFNRLKGVKCRLLEDKTGIIGNELVFQGKMDGVFHAFIILNNDPDDAFFDKKHLVGYDVWLAQYLLPLKCFDEAVLQQMIHFCLGNGNHGANGCSDLLHCLVLSS